MGFAGNDHFSNGLIRKYTTAFGSLFDDLSIVRESNSGTTQTLKVPIAYGPKERYLIRTKQDPDLDRKVSMQLPRMSFELLDLSYSPERKKSTTLKNRYVDVNDANKLNTQFSPVPYDLTFELNIMTKFMDDSLQVVEQILPFFTPDWTISMNLVPTMGLTRDIPIELTSVSMQDSYEGSFEERRAIVWTLNFIVKGYLYGPVSKTGLIKKTILNFYADSDLSANVSSRITTIPGVTVANTPTSNVELAIDYRNVKETDDYGFASNTQFFTSGRE